MSARRMLLCWIDIWRVVVTGSQWFPRSEWFPGSNREQGRPELSKEALMELEVPEDEAQS